MKKLLKSLFLFALCFLTYKNVYASGIDVCSSCDYHNLDEVFSAIQDGYFSDDYVNVYLIDSSGSYSFNHDYRFQLFVSIMQDAPIDGNNITIDGRGHTITSNEGVNIMSYDVPLIVKNMTVQCSNLDYEFALGLSSYYSKVEADNIKIINSGSLSIDFMNLGLFAYTDDFKLSNSIISNFAYAMSNTFVFAGDHGKRIDPDLISSYHHGNEVIGTFGDDTHITSLKIDSSDLYENAISFAGGFDGDIHDSKVASILLVNEDKSDINLFIDSSNDYGDVKIKRVSADTFFGGSGESEEKSAPSRDDVFNQFLNHDYMFLITDRYSNVEIEAKKSNSFNINTTKSVDLLSYFIDQEDINLDDYEFRVSDPSIASIENGQVVFLKSGEVDVTATNKKTKDVYTVHLKLESPVNPKTINSLYIMFVVLLFMISSIYAIRLRKRNN